MIKRPLYQILSEKFLTMNQMLFITGPRQSGKTTMAKAVMATFPDNQYLNWDIATDRKLIRTNPYFYETKDRHGDKAPLVVFDEIHKYSNWKNYLKGVYDRDQGRFRFLVTGSGRLDAFRKGGDSLAGRYFLIHVWPFTLAELAQERRTFLDFIEDPLGKSRGESQTLWTQWNQLSELSGFPTPYLSGDKHIYRIWSETYRNQLIREDLRNLSGILKIDELEALVDILPNRVGSPLSINNLAGDIGVSFESVKSWIETLERFYLCFRIAPHSNKISRSIVKEQKLYFFDGAQIEDPAARFENMVALELLRATTSWRESGHGEFSLRYVRNKEKEECDFVIVQKNKPILLIECKLSDPSPSKALLKFQGYLNIPAIQLINKTGISRRIRNGSQELLVVSAPEWLAGLP